jgi:hypothetical protein
MGHADPNTLETARFTAERRLRFDFASGCSAAI